MAEVITEVRLNFRLKKLKLKKELWKESEWDFCSIELV
jgi:hypothetical protein